MRLSELPNTLEELQRELQWCKEHIRELERDRPKRAREDSAYKVHLRMFPTKYDSTWLKGRMEDRFGPVRFVRVNPGKDDSTYTWASVTFENHDDCAACLDAAKDLEDRYGFQTKPHQDRVEKKRL